jgi:hypothetical protein
MVEPDVLAVPSVDRHQGLSEQRWQLSPGHAAGVQQVLLGRSGPAQWLLDLGLVEFCLGLGQPTQGIGIGAKQPQRRVFSGTDRQQPLEQLGEDQIVFADVVGRLTVGSRTSGAYMEADDAS